MTDTHDAKPRADSSENQNNKNVDEPGLSKMKAEHQEASLFTDMFATSPIGIYVVQDGDFTFVNPEMLRILGYEENELVGTKSLNIVFPEDQEKVRNNAVQMLKGKRFSAYMYRAVGKDEDIRWIIESVTSINYRGRLATLGYFMDNTENERAKEALEISEEKFHKAFRSSPDWVVITTLEDGFYIDVNEAFLKTTGYRRDEVIGRTSRELGIWADPGKRDEMVKVLREKGVVRNMEVKFRIKSGETLFVLWSAEVIDYGDEKCLIAVTRDITAIKQAEQERLGREKVQSVLETAGAACHELNQPLQFAFFLLSEISEEHQKSESIEELEKQLNRMKEITAKLENITRYKTTDYIKGEKIIDIQNS